MFSSKHENFGEDLLAINIQRGREHGLPPYNEFRQWCGMERLSSWSRVPEEHETEYWRKLSNVYESVEDIDLYSGAIAEKAVRGGAVGPTFACLIGEQFDRYSFVLTNHFSSFIKVCHFIWKGFADTFSTLNEIEAIGHRASGGPIWQNA